MLTDPSPPPSLQLVSIISSIVVFITLVGLTGLFTFLPIVSASVMRCHSALCHGKQLLFYRVRANNCDDMPISGMCVVELSRQAGN